MSHGFRLFVEPVDCQCRYRGACHLQCLVVDLECLLSEFKLVFRNANFEHCILVAGYLNCFNTNSMIKPWWLPQSCLIGTLHGRQETGNC